MMPSLMAWLLPFSNVATIRIFEKPDTTSPTLMGSISEIACFSVIVMVALDVEVVSSGIRSSHPQFISEKPSRNAVNK